MSEARRVMVYEQVHCPFCGDTDIYQSTETFNYKAGFWGGFFLHAFGALIFGFLCRKRIECHCLECGGDFSYYESERP